MSVEDLIGAGRTMVADTLIDTGVVRRAGVGPAILDELTGVLSPAAPTVIYNGPCRIKRPTQVEREYVFGDINTAVMRLIVNLPHTAAAIRVGDTFEATSSRDSQLVGRPLRVAAVITTSTLMFRQLGVEAVEDDR